MIRTVRAVRHRGLAALGVVLASVVLCAPLPGQQLKKASAKPVEEGAAVEPQTTGNGPVPIEAHFSDGSMLRLTLREEHVEMVTPYGRLVIPVADVRRIDFGFHCDAATAKRVQAAVAALGSGDDKERETAAAALLDLGESAVPALTEATKGKDAEAVQRAEALLNKLRERLPPDRMDRPANDVIETADSKITGRIAAEVFKVKTAQFGDQQVKLGDLACLGPKKVDDAEAIFINQGQFGPGFGGPGMPGIGGPGGFRPGGRVRGQGPGGIGLQPGGVRGPGARFPAVLGRSVASRHLRKRRVNEMR